MIYFNIENILVIEVVMLWKYVLSKKFEFKIYLVHNELSPLNNIKEMLLVWVHLVITTFKLENGVISYKRNTLNM